MEEGIVKWYSTEKGSGFIQSSDDKEYIVHRSGLQDMATTLEKGQRVQFEIDQREKGPMAVQVQPLAAEEA